MKISFRQTGGFAGLTRQCQVDDSLLSSDEATRLATLVKDADIHGSFIHKSPLARDAQQYVISIEHDHKIDNLTIDDLSLTPPLRRLIQFLQQHAGIVSG